MNAPPRGLLLVWTNIPQDLDRDFNEWYNREHMPERVGIPGFLRGRRYIALDARPEFFTLYETASPAVTTG